MSESTQRQRLTGRGSVPRDIILGLQYVSYHFISLCLHMTVRFNLNVIMYLSVIW